MRSSLATVLVFVGLLALPLGCDWTPGSKFGWSQTVRTWDDLESGDCLLLGTYTFAVGANFPPFDAKASIKMTADNKDDQEFLPRDFLINYRFDGGIFYQQDFELNKGKGSYKEEQPDSWTFNPGDEIDYEICVFDGYLPFFTEISARFDYKFAKPDFK